MTRSTITPAKTEYPARKPIPWQIYALCYHRQNGKCAGCGLDLDLFTPRAVHADHDPALTIRPVDDLGTDYVPPQLDPNHIFLLGYECCHKEKSRGDTSRGAKVKRILGETKGGPKKKIQSRPFDKSLRKKVNGTVEKRT